MFMVREHVLTTDAVNKVMASLMITAMDCDAGEIMEEAKKVVNSIEGDGERKTAVLCTAVCAMMGSLVRNLGDLLNMTVDGLLDGDEAMVVCDAAWSAAKKLKEGDDA